MLRLVVLLLLAANIVFFGWARAWFAPGWPPPRHGEREPERLAAQVQPQLVTVLPPKAASAAVSAAVSAARAAAAVCLQAGPFAADELAAAQAALPAASMPEGALTREAVPPPPPWLVYIGRVADAAVRRAREAELNKLGLAFQVIEAPAELAPGLVLSRHASKEEAEQALAALAASQPPRGARVVALPPPAPRFWLRAARADAEQQQRLQALPAAGLAGGFKPCAPTS